MRVSEYLQTLVLIKHCLIINNFYGEIDIVWLETIKYFSGEVAKSHILWLVVLLWFKNTSPLLSFLKTTV